MSWAIWITGIPGSGKSAIARAAATELEASGEIKIETAPEYVIGYMCRELAAKWVVASSALGRER